MNIHLKEKGEREIDQWPQLPRREERKRTFFSWVLVKPPLPKWSQQVRYLPEISLYLYLWIEYITRTFFLKWASDEEKTLKWICFAFRILVWNVSLLFVSFTEPTDWKSVRICPFNTFDKDSFLVNWTNYYCHYVYHFFFFLCTRRETCRLLKVAPIYYIIIRNS